MTKIVKMSLIAAIAVAGTTASAQPLAEAIKNVDVSGSVVYRYDDREDSASAQNNRAGNNYKAAVSLKSKVTDDVTFNSRFIAGNETGPLSLGTSTSADKNLDIGLSEANFSYTGIANASITLGKQGVATPFTVARDAMGGESTGTGLLATYTFAPVTVAGAYFNQTNIAAAADLTVIGLMGSFGGINADAWYLDAKNAYNIYTLGLSANYTVSGIALSPTVRYTSQDDDANLKSDAELLRVGMGASVGIYDAYIGYGKTGKDAGVTVDENSSDMIFDQHWRVSLSDQADSDILFVNAGAQVTEKVHVALKHSNLDRPTASLDEKETYVQVLYTPAKNLTAYVRFGEYKKETNKSATSGRVHIQYSF